MSEFATRTKSPFRYDIVGSFLRPAKINGCSKRAGGFEPLKQVPDDKYVVLRLVSSKSGQLEDRNKIITRIKEAAKFHLLDRLFLTPQCGFASIEESNILTAEQQWNKIRFIKEIATEVWEN